jgi:predicted DNA-binding transcriptional regulator YafY
MRIAEEAREQGGVLTQEDLGVLLSCDERTVRRDIKDLRTQGIHVPTRGFIQDIGPTVSHKAQAIRHWLEGKEPVSVARAINHSLAAVERYLDDFKRVSLLAMKGLDATATARAANLSPTLVATYQAMYQEAKEKPQYGYRFKELAQLIAGEPADTVSDGKKGAL